MLETLIDMTALDWITKNQFCEKSCFKDLHFSAAIKFANFFEIFRWFLARFIVGGYITDTKGLDINL